jgi:hypothetical protein
MKLKRRKSSISPFDKIILDESIRVDDQSMITHFYAPKNSVFPAGLYGCNPHGVLTLDGDYFTTISVKNLKENPFYSHKSTYIEKVEKNKRNIGDVWTEDNEAVYQKKLKKFDVKRPIKLLKTPTSNNARVKPRGKRNLTI